MISLKNLASNFKESISSAFYDAFYNTGFIAVLLYLPVGIYIIYINPIQNQFSIGKYYQILTTQARVLGTFLVILFSTTVVMAQIVARYSERAISDVIGGWAVLYLSAYLIGVTAPILIIYTDFWMPGVRFSILWTGLCISLLFPFAMSLKNFMSIYYYIDRLEIRVEHLLLVSGDDRNIIDKAAQNIEKISRVVVGSVNHHNYAVFEHGLTTIEEIWSKTILHVDSSSMTFGKNKDSIVREKVINPIKDLAEMKMDDPKVPDRCAYFFRSIGRLGIEQGVEDITRECQSGLRNLGQYAARKQMVGTRVTHSVRGLGSIGRIAAQHNKLDNCQYSIKGLTSILNTPQIENVARHVYVTKICLQEIENICTYFIKNNNIESGDRAYKIGRASISSIFKVTSENLYDTDVVVPKNAIENFRIINKTFHKNAITVMSEAKQKKLVDESVEYAIKIAETVQENKSTSEWPEIVEVLTYFVQNCVENGDIDAADRLLDELDEMTRQVVDRASADHPIWKTCGKLGYVVQRYLEVDPERADKAHKLLQHVTDRAMEVSISTESMTDLLRAHRSVLQKRGG